MTKLNNISDFSYSVQPCKMHLFVEYYQRLPLTDDEEAGKFMLKVPLSSLVTICALKQAKCHSTGYFIT